MSKARANFDIFVLNHVVVGQSIQTHRDPYDIGSDSDESCRSEDVGWSIADAYSGLCQTKLPVTPILLERARQYLDAMVDLVCARNVYCPMSKKSYMNDWRNRHGLVMNTYNCCTTWTLKCSFKKSKQEHDKILGSVASHCTGQGGGFSAEEITIEFNHVVLRSFASAKYELGSFVFPGKVYLSFHSSWLYMI